MKRATKKKVALGIHNESVPLGAHIAYFWESDEEFAQGVRFLETGFRGHDAAVVFGHEVGNRKVLDVLTKSGHDVDSLQTVGRLAVMGVSPTGEAMLQAIAGTFQRMQSAGWSLIRLLGNIGWGREGWPTEDAILEFEARVTGAALQFPCVVICMYDVRSLSGRVVLHGAFETHPLTIFGNVMRENPYHLGLNEYLDRIKRSA